MSHELRTWNGRRQPDAPQRLLRDGCQPLGCLHGGEILGTRSDEL